MFNDFNAILELVEKAFFVLGAILYFVFAFIVVKQTTMMSRNVSDKFNAILITFSYIHLAFSVFLIVMTLLVL